MLLLSRVTAGRDGGTMTGRGGEGAAVFQGDLGGEVFAGMELRRVEVIRKREEKIFFGCGPAVGVCGRWGEGEVVEDELLDLVEARARQLGGGVAGVVGEPVELGRLGVIGEAYGVGLENAVLLDGEVESAGIVRGQGEGYVDGAG